MVARSIHRFSAFDALFPGAREACIGDIAGKKIVIFGAEKYSAQAIRDAATHLKSGQANDVDILDLGNLEDPAEALSSLLKYVGQFQAIPFMLGGDYLLGQNFIKSLYSSFKKSQTALILLSPNINIGFDRARGLESIAIGTKRYVPTRNLETWKASGGKFITANQVNRESVREALKGLSKKIANTILIIDVSVIDIGYAAGSDNPNIGGLTPNVVTEIIDEILINQKIGGVAFLNLRPEKDYRGHSEIIAASIALNIVEKTSVRAI